MERSGDVLLSRYSRKLLEASDLRLSGMPFALLNASVTTGAKHLDFIREDYPFDVVEYVEKGTGQVEVENHKFQVNEGDVYILPRHTSHRLRITDDNNIWIKRFVVSCGPLVEHLLEVYQLRGLYHYPECHSPELLEEFKKIQNIFKEGGPDMHDRTACILLRIIQFLAHHIRGSDKRSLDALKIQYYLDRKLFFKLDLNVMCRDLGMSRSKLIRICRSELGDTPYNCHLKKRMDMARHLLTQDSAASISEIAAQLHFHDQYHFSRIFKQKTGFSPSGYRSRTRADTA